MLTLADVKRNSRIDGDAEDALLEAFIAAAEDMIAAETGLDLDEAPPRARQAGLLLVAHWYANREAVSADGHKPVPLAYGYIMASLRPATSGIVSPEPETGE